MGSKKYATEWSLKSGETYPIFSFRRKDISLECEVTEEKNGSIHFCENLMCSEKIDRASKREE